jgi:hypothetical protein
MEAPIDVLQVDVEGADDDVIYSSSIDVTSPRIVNFESVHLDAARRSKLFRYLESRGYSLIHWGMIVLVLRRGAFRPFVSFPEWRTV